MKPFLKATLTVFLLLLAVLYSPLLTYAAEASAAQEQTVSDVPITDHLETEGDTRRYFFEFAESGDAAILLRAKQDSWGGYTYYWRIRVYAAGATEPIADQNAKGHNNLTVVALDNITAGRYVVEVSSPKSGNPLMAGFTTDPYEIAVLSLYDSYDPDFEKDELALFDQQYQVIGKVDGTWFIKTGGGAAYGAFYRNDEGAILPILLSEDENAVSYFISSTGEHVTTSESVEKDGKTYYYTAAHWVDRYEKGWQSEKDANYCFFDVEGDADAAEEILIKLEKQEKGLFWYFVSNYWYWPLLVLLFIAFLWMTSFFQYDGPA